MSQPTLFGSYLLHEPIAGSETSEIFLAQTVGEFPRLCVVKRIRPELSTLPDFSERFRADAALLVRMIHGNVVQVLEVGTVEGQPFVAMEQVDGVELRQLVTDPTGKGSLAADAALYIALELCEAVSYVHMRRREHESTAQFTFDQAWPLDTMLSFDGAVKIVSPGSFGALRIGKRKISEVLRSPGYAAPEVVLKQPLDGRSDVFAVGLLIWETLYGRALISSDPEDYVREVLDGSWQAPLITRKDVPGDVIRTIASMLQLDPNKRPISLEAVRGPLVEGLRRMAPTYGSAALSRLLLRRCAREISERQALTEELTQRALTVRTTVPGPNSLTFGHAHTATRDIVRPIELKPGDQIPGTRYRLVRALGKGGSADVFAAQHIHLDRQVALKVLAPELANQARAIAQFRLEARTCSRMGHPNIVDVIDFGELEDGRFFFAMELLAGASLGQLLGHHRRLPAQRAIPIFRQIAKALQAAHEHGVIHRDLKPENVMLVEREGRADFVKVLDFGVMAFSADHVVERVGTPGYIAPEQLDGQRPDPRMDIYSMGAALYEVLCGELPYEGETVQEYLEEQRVCAAPALRTRKGGHNVPVALERVVHRALERNADARHPSAADFEAALIHAQRKAGITTPWDDMPPPERLRDRRGRAAQGLDPTGIQGRRKHAMAWIAGASASLAVVAALLVAGKVQRAAPAAPDQPSKAPAAAAAPAASAASATARQAERPTVVQRHNDDINEPTAAATAATVPGPRTVGQRERRRMREPVAAAPTASSPTRARELVAQGRTLLHTRDLTEADRRFHAAAVADPRSADALFGLASVAFQRARYADSVAHARRAVALNRRHVEAHLLLGDAYAKLLRQNEAMRAWQRALKVDPENQRAAGRISRATAVQTPRGP